MGCPEQSLTFMWCEISHPAMNVCGFLLLQRKSSVCFSAALISSETSPENGELSLRVRSVQRVTSCHTVAYGLNGKVSSERPDRTAEV